MEIGLHYLMIDLTNIEHIIWYISRYISAMENIMTQTAKIFMSGRSQAVRLPAEFRFDTKEVYVTKNPITGDVILSKKPNDWSELFAMIKEANANGDVPEDFLSPESREQGVHDRDPLEGID